MNDILANLSFVATAVWRVWPLFLASIVLSVLIRRLDLDRFIRRAFDAHAGKAVLLATAIGAFSPFCSCTVVPVIAGLLASGVPLAPIMSFWIASPTMDPEIFTLSVGVLGWEMALIRLGATLLVSLAAGYITIVVTRRLKVLANVGPQMAKEDDCGCTPEFGSAIGTAVTASAGASEFQTVPIFSLTESLPISEIGLDSALVQPTAYGTIWNRVRHAIIGVDWHEFGQEVAGQSWKLGRWLLLAFFLEALITSYIPQASIASILGGENLFAVPLATLIGIPLYLNNFSALPIVSGLLSQGMQPGAAIAFLIAGPVTTIPAMTAVFGIVEKRIFALYLVISLGGAMAMGILTNLLFG